MKTVTSVKALREVLSAVDSTGIGLVPTMGALHAGHRSLVERARRENATVVVSVFVNPTQFNDKNDLRNYPRTPEADCALLEAAGADVVFMPSVEEMYPVPDLRQYDFGRIDKVMEGATRPGHFNGVAQVVSTAGRKAPKCSGGGWKKKRSMMPQLFLHCISSFR